MRDAINFPLLLVEGDYQLFPIESVFCVIEVKSILNNKEINDCVIKISKVKSLSGGQKIVGAAFSYSTSFRKKPAIDTTAKTLLKLNNEIDKSDRIDLLTILDDGMIIRHPPEEGYIGCYELFLELEVPNLLWFLLNLLEKISTISGTSTAFEVLYIYSGGAIGLVRKIPESLSEINLNF